MDFPRMTRWQAAAYIGTAANGGFTQAELTTSGTRYLWHAIHIITEDDVGSNGATAADKGKARLALNDDRIDGFFISFDGHTNPVVIFQDSSKGSFARNGTTAIINVGTRLVGAEKSVTGDYPQAGYVKPVTTLPTADTAAAAKVAIDKALTAVNNIVRDPQGSAGVDNAYPAADVVVEHGIATDAGI